VALAVAIFAVVDMAYFGLPVISHLGRFCACQSVPDPTVYMWFLAWWPHALLHSLNPFVTNALFAPNQINLGAVDLVPGAAILMAPVTLLFGPLVSYNVLALAAPLLAAVFAFLLCRYITRNVPASLVGAYIFAFSPYMLGHMETHLDLSLVFPISAAIHLTLRVIDERISRRRFTVLMALLLILLFLTQPELTFTAVVLGAIALGLAALLVPSHRARIASVIVPLLGAGAIALVLTSVFIYYALTGDFSNAFFAKFGDTFSADALGFLIPTSVVRVGRSWFSNVSATFYGGTPENGVYVGVVMALVVARYVITRWARPGTRLLLAMLGLVVVLMLGSHLRFAGRWTIPLPWHWLSHLPLLFKVAPIRLGVYMYLIVAVIVALWLAQPRSHRLQVTKWAVAALVLITLLPNLNAGLWKAQPTNPSLFADSGYRTVLRPGEIVLELPLTTSADNMLWQAEAGFNFRMADGYLGALTPASFARDLTPAVATVRNQPDPAALQDFLVDRRVTAVLVDARNPEHWPAALASIGLRPRHVGGEYVYRVG
jgi:hypothetical protein